MSNAHGARSWTFCTAVGVLVAVNAACGLDAVDHASDLLGDSLDAGGPASGDNDGVVTPEPDDEPDSGSDIDPGSDAAGPDESDADTDASIIDDPSDGGSTAYRDDWFDRTADSPAWTATWWKPNTCRDKEVIVGSKIGPKIIDLSTKTEKSPLPAGDRPDTLEGWLEFPRDGSTWPDKNGVPGIAETDEAPLVGKTYAFCARFHVALPLPPGKYVLTYEVSESLMMFVDDAVVNGPVWYEAISGTDVLGSTQKGTAEFTLSSTSASRDVRIYYNNVIKDAVMKLKLAGPT